MDSLLSSSLVLSYLFYSLLFSSLLFYSLLLYSLLFFSILFYSLLFFYLLFSSLLFDNIFMDTDYKITLGSTPSALPQLIGLSVKREGRNHCIWLTCARCELTSFRRCMFNSMSSMAHSHALVC